MNTQTQEALKMAVKALDTLMMEKGSIYQQALQACKEALEQHQEEVPKGVLQAIDKYGLSLLKTAHGFELRKLGKTEASSIVEQPAQEPVTFCKHGVPRGVCTLGEKDCNPAQACQECENLKHDLEGYMDANKALINREWQGLSDDEIKKVFHDIVAGVYGEDDFWFRFARAIDQASKEKNNG